MNTFKKGNNLPESYIKKGLTLQKLLSKLRSVFKINKTPESELKKMIKELVRETNKELENIKNFLDILYEEGYKTNLEFLNMTLSEFCEKLENIKTKIITQLRFELDTQRTKSMFKKIEKIEKILNFIDFYVKKSKSTKKDKEIESIDSNRTTLRQLIEILERRILYLNELLNYRK